MKFKKRIALVAGAVLVLVIATCTFSTPHPKQAVVSSRSVTYEDLTGFGYMGGSLIADEKTPLAGHVVKGAVIPVRFGAVEQVQAEEKTVYRNITEKETFGYLQINEVVAGKISFNFTRVTADAKTTSTYSLSLGDELDLNGDGKPDITYVDFPENRVGFEHAKLLTFISSKEEKTTTMFAVLPEQYPHDEYPQGIMGVNTDGKFIYSKYVPAADGTSRSVSHVRGVQDGDFVLDAVEGNYFETEGTVDAGNARTVSATELKSKREADITEVLPLASWKASSKKVPAEKKKKEVKAPYSAKTYAEFAQKRAAIREQFESFKPVFVIRPEKLLAYTLDAVEEIPISSQDLPDISGENQLLLETAVGLFGEMSISWSHFESNLMVGVFVDTNVDLSVNETMQSKDFGVPGKKFLQDKYTFMAGPVPITLACPMSFVMPVTAQLKGDEKFGFFAGFTGLYGAGADFGWTTNWDALKIKKDDEPKKKFIESYSQQYVINEAVVFAGSKHDLYTESKAHVEANITLAPKFSMAPEIGIANAVSTGFEGSYEMPMLIGIAARQEAVNPQKFVTWGDIQLAHNFELFWNLKVIGLKPVHLPVVKTGEKKIGSWEIRF